MTRRLLISVIASTRPAGAEHTGMNVETPSRSAREHHRQTRLPFAAAPAARQFSVLLGTVALALLTALPGKTAEVPPLSQMLDHIGQRVEKFWNYFSSVNCTERVIQTKLGDRGKVLFERRETFDYLILLQSHGMDISVDESRVEKTHAGSKGNMPLLETNGFSIFSLIFHPLYQSRYQFSRAPDDLTDGRRLLCIAFKQVSRDHPLSVLRLRGQDYPLEWRGMAWIDPASLEVVRIQAGLGDSLADIGLLRLQADVTYSDIHLSGAAEYWLPVRATIEAQTKRQHWQNTHVFSDYKRFSVDTDVSISAPQ